MKYRFLAYGVVAVAVASVLSLVSVSAAQNGAPTGNPPCTGCSVDGKTTPRSSDGHTDLNGLWGAVGSVATDIASRAADGSTLYDFSGGQLGPDGRTRSSTPVTDLAREGIDTEGKNLSEPSYKPEYAAKVKAMVDNDQYGTISAEDPMLACKPLGVPRGAVGGTMQIVQTSQVVAFLYENEPGPVFRLIYTDGRSHPKPDDLDTSFLGDSIGHWERDTLVVDTIGLNDETWLAGGFAPKYARIHSDQEHVIERWTRDGDMLTYEATVEDPVMFTKPWVITPRHIRHAGPDGRIFNDPCVGKDEGHIIKPTKEDPFVCNYCRIKATGTIGTGSTAPEKKP